MHLLMVNFEIEKLTLMQNRIFTYTILCLFFIFSSCASKVEKEEHEEENHSHSEVSIEPEIAKQFGVEYEIVTSGSFHDVIKTSGIIESSRSDINTISARRSGIITLSPGISIGSEVRANQSIASITSEGVQGGDLNQAAKANLEAAKAEYDRLKPLYEDRLVAASVFREAERAYNEAKALSGKVGNGASTVVVSPGEGTVQNLFVSSGDYVDVGNQIGIVVKNSNLMLRADLPVRESKHMGEISDAFIIPEGTQEIIKLSELNGRKVSGNIVSSENGFLPVYFSFTGNPLAFPGGYAEVFLICGERNGVISVPRDALVEIQGNKYAYVAEDDHDYEKRKVKTGASDGERIEILEGLSPGDKVVSKGASVIRMAEVSAIAPPAHTHSH